MRTHPFLESTDAALVNHGSNLQSAFAEFTKWNYYTADRANTVNYYPEGIHYPRFQPLQKISFYNTTSTTSGNVEPLSSSMYEFDMQQDTITAIIANVDISNAIIRNITPQRIDVTLSSQSLSAPYQEFANGLKAKVSVADTSLWRFFFSKKVMHADASPNPFRLAETQRLLLPVNGDPSRTAEVYFFSSSLDLAYSGQANISYEYDTRVIIVPTSQVKSKLSSGIYFILAKTANSTYKWKVAVIR
jgi:hypothetical protein